MTHLFIFRLFPMFTDNYVNETAHGPIRPCESCGYLHGYCALINKIISPILLQEIRFLLWKSCQKNSEEKILEV